MNYTRYAIVDARGQYVERTHQDDESDPIVATTLATLVAAAADHCDVFSEHFFDLFRDGGDLAGCKIVREELVQSDLNADDLVVLQKVRDDIAAEKERFQREYMGRMVRKDGPATEESDEDDSEEDEDEEETL
jgi:hypothetical protein